MGCGWRLGAGCWCGIRKRGCVGFPFVLVTACDYLLLGLVILVTLLSEMLLLLALLLSRLLLRLLVLVLLLRLLLLTILLALVMWVVVPLVTTVWLWVAARSLVANLDL